MLQPFLKMLILLLSGQVKIRIYVCVNTYKLTQYDQITCQVGLMDWVSSCQSMCGFCGTRSASPRKNPRLLIVMTEMVVTMIWQHDAEKQQQDKYNRVVCVALKKSYERNW